MRHLAESACGSLIISYTLLYQENVPDGIRGLVGGTQQSLNSLFTILTGCVGIYFSHPDEFWILATAGYGCIAVSMLLYIFGIFLPSTKRFALHRSQIKLVDEV